MAFSYKSGFFASVIKGALFSVCVMLFCVLAFALIYGAAGLTNTVIKPVNQVIKVLAIFVGTVRFRGDKGLLRGAVIGVLTIAVSYLLFALIGGIRLIGVGFLFDLIFGLAAGGLSGAISVNLKGGR